MRGDEHVNAFVRDVVMNVLKVFDQKYWLVEEESCDDVYDR